MTQTLNNVLVDVASYINQDPTVPSGTDLTMWVNLINQAQDEWASAYQWKQNRISFNPTTTFSGTSIALPANFKKLMSPMFDMSLPAGSGNEYSEINPSDRFLANTTDKYIYIDGNNVTGWTLHINPPVASGASLALDMQVYPSSLATFTDNVTCPDSKFLSRRTIASILGARSDPRFTIITQEAQSLLANMIEEEATPAGSEINQTPNYYKRVNFRIGES